MKIHIHQSADTGRADDFTAEAEGLPRKGIGKDADQALGSLIRANLDAVGVTEIEQDVLSLERDKAGNRIRKTFCWKASEWVAKE